MQPDARPLLLVDVSYLALHVWVRLAAPTLDLLAAAVVEELRMLVRQFGPARVRAALDSPFPSFRAERIPGYERSRTRPGIPSPSDRCDACRRALARAGIAMREGDGVEALDVLATLVSEAVTARVPRVYVASGTTDALQLVSDPAGVRAIWPTRGGWRELDGPKVRAYFAQHPEHRAPLRPCMLLDLRTLAGGRAGLPRVEVREGPKPWGFTTRRASQLLCAGATLDTLYDEHRGLLSDREAGWLDTCRADALARREALRLRSAVALVGDGDAQLRAEVPPAACQDPAPAELVEEPRPPRRAPARWGAWGEEARSW